MPNMSYCRFRNTLRDLKDCFDSEEMWEPEDLSEEEQRARKRLIEICHMISSEFEEEDL